jgi:DNA-binding transcriptional MerR regulator
MKNASTVQVARLLGISKNTLLSWLYQGKIPEPKRHKNGGQDIRLWSAADIERARKYKEANYRKGRGRKKKA